MLKKKNCALLGLEILLGVTYEFLKEIEDSIRELVDRYKNNLNEKD